MSATLNTFPPFQSMNSPRGWILAVIVLLHLGFFWLLSTSMGQAIIQKWNPPSIMVDVQRQPPVEPQPQHRQFTPDRFDQWRIFVPRPDDPKYQPDDTADAIRDEPRGGGETPTDDGIEPTPVTVIAVPQIDIVRCLDHDIFRWRQQHIDYSHGHP